MAVKGPSQAMVYPHPTTYAVQAITVGGPRLKIL